MKFKSVLFLIIVFIVTALAATFSYQPAWNKALDTLGFSDKLSRPWRLGLDLVGGAHLAYEVDLSNIAQTDRGSVMSGLRDLIERRVNLFGVSEPRVETAQSRDSHRLIVELAGVKDLATAVKEIGETPFLDFREVEETATSSVATSTNIIFKPTDLTGRYIKSAKVDFDQITREPRVLLEFNSEGAKIFEDLTAKNVEKPLAIFLDDNLIEMPIVREKITGGTAQITGRFTFDEAKKMVERFNAGALPAPIKLVGQQSVGATLGDEALNLGIKAGLIGLALVFLFMIGYYRFFGFFACLALTVYVVVVLAIFKLLPVTMTLAGIAGFIISVGMAVDANILIFERTKEELRKGISRPSAIEEGFRRAWFSIRDANVTTIISAFILYFFTTSLVQGFALTLFIGVLISMFSAITVTRMFLKTLIRS